MITHAESHRFKERPLVIGFGLAGIFASLELVDRGEKPVVFERGRRLEERAVDVQRFIDDRVLDPESNIQFGEGGAGAYSDGKLFSRAHNSNCVAKALATFIRFGAPDDIGVVRKPHLGTDVLCVIARNMREHILARGGEIHYGSKMTDILTSGRDAVGVVINDEKEFRSSRIVLAIGHSARDTFRMMRRKGVALEQKAISVGVRVEHPAELINRMRGGESCGGRTAQYSLTYTDRKSRRGVYTFCMCPGGEVINASSEPGMLVVNGMSYSRRDSAFSNAAIVVTCQTGDYGASDPLAGIEFQEKIERAAFAAGGGRWMAPAQNMMDFLDDRLSVRLNENSFKMGTTPARMGDLFPTFVGDSLGDAFRHWRTDYPTFVSDRALLLGAETRTSCPVRIRRGVDYESVNMKNLYPIGEGSGYTGGITSSAADAIRAVESMGM
ncbi:MAG TPA: dehydrogenase [Elusimicrobiota bacterium]|nr:dehydrogenase [Elusimicrobiota bacterium]